MAKVGIITNNYVSDSVAVPISLSPPHQYSNSDLSVISDILRCAERTFLKESPTPPDYASFTLLHILKAYAAVLTRRGIDPAEDTHFYRFLLKLSVDPDNDWWSKFDKECKRNAQTRLASEHFSDEAKRRAFVNWRAGWRVADELRADGESPPATADQSGVDVFPSGFLDSIDSVPNAFTPGARDSRSLGGTNASAAYQVHGFSTGDRASSAVHDLPIDKWISVSQHSLSEPHLNHSDLPPHASDQRRDLYVNAHISPPTKGPRSRRNTIDQSPKNLEETAFGRYSMVKNAFLAWRNNVLWRKSARIAKESAVNNWNRATQFWQKSTTTKACRGWKAKTKSTKRLSAIQILKAATHFNSILLRKHAVSWKELINSWNLRVFTIQNRITKRIFTAWS
eukprot:164931_1